MRISADIQGDRVVAAQLQRLGRRLPKAVRRGMTRSVQGIYREAFANLSGPGRTKVKRTTRARGQADMIGARPGSYPVPVLSGNLRRLLNWLKPGQKKGDFEAGDMEAIVYNSAEYAHEIKDGIGTSAAYGPRDYAGDALDRFNEGDKIVGNIEDEIDKEINTL